MGECPLYVRVRVLYHDGLRGERQASLTLFLHRLCVRGSGLSEVVRVLGRKFVHEEMVLLHLDWLFLEAECHVVTAFSTRQ